MDAVVAWLLAGDVSVRYQTGRDLLHGDDADLQARISVEGDGATILAARRADGHWGRGFYQPKWTSSHYTLLELRNLGLDPAHPAASATVALVLRDHKSLDGGLDPRVAVRRSDACVNGMALNYAAYFGAGEEQLASVVDCLLSGRIADGGFNCRRGPEVRHSSMHTTLSSSKESPATCVPATSTGSTTSWTPGRPASSSSCATASSAASAQGS